MDHTQLFHATVRTIRLQLKAQRRESGSPSSSLTSSSSLLTKSSKRAKTDFSIEAKDVATCITKLQDYLLKHRKDYINSTGYLFSKPSAMSDSERDEIDSEAQKFMQSCSERIKTLHESVLALGVGQQTRIHRQAVYESLGDYLRKVCKLYSEQKAVRVKRIVDRKQISRLQPESQKKLMMVSTSSSPLHARERNTTTQQPRVSEEGTDDSGTQLEQNSDGPPHNAVHQTTNPHLTGTSSNSDGFQGAAPSNDGLTEEERATFELENEQLFAEMNTMVDEVRQIEGRVIEISRLQEIFTERVLVQAKQLDTISSDTVQASENVKDGNEQIRGAIKNKASLRLWILFIFIVCSFSLLFLDWYS